MTVVARDARASLLITPSDPIPVGARFIETHFRDPEPGWSPVVLGATLATLYNGVLAAHPRPDTGRFPLPDADALREILGDWQIASDTPVVVYAVDPHDAKTAARAWFVLRHAGIHDVRMLDGGAAGWAQRTDAASAADDAVPTGGPGVVAIDDAEAAEVGRTGTLIDARPAFAYVEGHIPGAKCAPSDALFPDGYLLPADALADWAARVGVTAERPVAAYCGGGVAGAGAVFALATLGVDAPLYVGSWSQWSRLPGHPVER